jgi:uncharacterized membrane protein HdeD (DUF308 family)
MHKEEAMFAILTRHWWMVALRGVLAILFGLATFLWPALSLAALVLLFGAYALVDGVFAVVLGIRAHGERERWWALVLEGLAGLAIGVITFIWPAITALALLYLIAFWAIITGGFEIGAAIRLRKLIEGEWLLGISGALSVLFGLLLVVMPGAGALAVLWLIGIYALIFGALLIGLGLRLRGLGHIDRASPLAS